MVINENVLKQIRDERIRHQTVSADEGRVVLQYIDCINNGDMTIEEFVNKTKDFTDYWSDVQTKEVALKPIEIPQHLRKNS